MQSLLDNNRRTDISFSPNGCIDISAKVANILSLHAGDTIDVKFDGYEYYLYVRNVQPTFGRFEAQCFPSNRKGRHFRAYSSRLCSAMRQAYHADGRLRLSVGETHTICGSPYVTLITKNNIHNG